MSLNISIQNSLYKQLQYIKKLKIAAIYIWQYCTVLPSSSQLQKEAIGICKTDEGIIREHKFFFHFSLRG